MARGGEGVVEGEGGRLSWMGLEGHWREEIHFIGGHGRKPSELDGPRGALSTGGCRVSTVGSGGGSGRVDVKGISSDICDVTVGCRQVWDSLEPPGRAS